MDQYVSIHKSSIRYRKDKLVWLDLRKNLCPGCRQHEWQLNVCLYADDYYMECGVTFIPQEDYDKTLNSKVKSQKSKDCKTPRSKYRNTVKDKDTKTPR